MPGHLPFTSKKSATMKIITTSWDDGHELDFKIAGLLDKYNLQGTFYIPKNNGAQSIISESQMRQLAKSFEIGGHTLNHVRLYTKNEQILEQEIHGSYNWLANVLGERPFSFCFPGGVYNSTSLQAVFKHGYKLARTTELLSTALPHANRPLCTTLQLYRHSNATYAKHLAKRFKWQRLAAKLLYSNTADLLRLTNFYIDKIEAEGGCFHLWGHSWEIEEFGLWNKLEEVFKLLSNRSDFTCVPNQQLLHLV
jgi:peptidoglycan/xylan/chitin deacetylase (PgdA/CDA1 family)